MPSLFRRGLAHRICTKGVRRLTITFRLREFSMHCKLARCGDQRFRHRSLVEVYQATRNLIELCCFLYQCFCCFWLVSLVSLCYIVHFHCGSGNIARVPNHCGKRGHPALGEVQLYISGACLPCHVPPKLPLDIR